VNGWSYEDDMTHANLMVCDENFYNLCWWSLKWYL